MQVERIDNSLIAAMAGKKSQRTEEAVIEETVETVEEITDEPVEIEGNEQSEQPGVLRLLQEGHFKGVADVRLRINFYEELQALENEQLMEAAQSGFAVFNQTLETDIAALKDSGELTQEQLAAIDEFTAQVQGIQDGFDGTSPIADLLGSMQAQLDTLLGVLNPPVPLEPAVEPIEEPVDEISLSDTLESPDTASEPETEVVVAETEPEEPSAFLQLVTNLQNSFAQAVEQLQSDLNTSSVLGPLSEPSGNGKAYAKFLAIYEEMQNGQAPAIVDEIEAPVTEA